MKLSNAKQIQMIDLLANLGHHPKEKKKQGNEYWYTSPFRPNETEPSFHITVNKNIWYDFGEGKGGDIIEFVKTYGNTDFEGALKLLDDVCNIKSYTPANDNEIKKEVQEKKESEVKLIEVKPLFSFILKGYLKQRGISLNIADKYLKEVKYSVDGKEYFALGFQSRSGGYELRSPIFKNSIGTKDITVIEQDSNHEGSKVAVFEGFMDFLSYACMTNEKFGHDVVILNSSSLKQKAVEFISSQGYQDIHTNFDNDPTGEKVLEYFRENLKGKNIRTHNYIYSGFTDLNEYWAERVKAATPNQSRAGL